MSAPSAISIVQNAMRIAGLAPISSFEEEGPKAATVKGLYDSKRRAYLSMYPWKFATKRAQLSRLTSSPVAEWEYAFALPADRIMPPTAIYDSADPMTPPYKRFEISEDKLLSDTDALWAKYLYDQSEALWPPYFVDFVENAFGYEMALTGEDARKKQDLGRIAFGLPEEGGLGGKYLAARRADSRFNPSRTLLPGGGPLVRTRLRGSFIPRVDFPE